MISGWRHTWIPDPDWIGFDYVLSHDGIIDQQGRDVTKEISFHDSLMNGKLIRNFPAGQLEGTISLGDGQTPVTMMNGDSLEVTWTNVVTGSSPNSILRRS